MQGRGVKDSRIGVLPRADHSGETMVIDLAFLGTGSAFSAGRRSNLALLVEAASFRLLVEVGPAIVQQLARADTRPREIERLFVSHSHGDHSLGFPIFALNRLPAPPPLHIYAAASTAAATWRL